MIISEPGIQRHGRYLCHWYLTFIFLLMKRLLMERGQVAIRTTLIMARDSVKKIKILETNIGRITKQDLSYDEPKKGLKLK